MGRTTSNEVPPPTPIRDAMRLVNVDRRVVAEQLLESGSRLRAQAHQLLEKTQAAVPFTSDLRLATARRNLDRMEGILAEVSRFVSIARALRYETEEEQQESLARSAADPSHMVARGFASAEREAAYTLANLSQVKVAAQMRHVLDQMLDLQRHLRGIASSINNHRIESLTLLRMNSQIAAEEYDTE